MLDLIIVEDEKILLDKLSKIVDYGKYGFNLVHLFSNGEDAINYIKCNKTDLVISDIKMPKATGLDIAKYIFENNMDTKIVILSGYNDFEYAKTSIKYNVFDFISKPFRKSEYTSMLENVYTNISNSNDKKNTTYESDAFFRGLCYGSYVNEKNIKHEIERLNLNIDIHDDPCMYFTLDIVNPEVYLNKDTHIIDNLTNIASNILILTDIPIKYCSVINFTSAHIEYFLVFASENVDKKIKKEIKDEITLFMKNLGLNVIIKNQFLFNNILEVIKQKVISLKELFSVYIQSFIDSLGSGDYDKIRNSSELVFQTVSRFDTDECTGMLITFINKINPILQMYQNRKIDTNEILKYANCEKQIECAKQLISDTTSACYSKSSLIDKITSYINQNYSKPITLDDVAKHSYISKIYLCQYIKKHTKMTFNEYITHIRVEKAKELLTNTDLKIYQICEMVGYKTTAHFIKIFKADAGITPSDYKRQHCKTKK